VLPFLARHMTQRTAYSPALVNLMIAPRPMKAYKTFFVLYKNCRMMSSDKWHFLPSLENWENPKIFR
jgi:hypothetical protein